MVRTADPTKPVRTEPEKLLQGASAPAGDWTRRLRSGRVGPGRFSMHVPRVGCGPYPPDARDQRNSALHGGIVLSSHLRPRAQPHPGEVHQVIPQYQPEDDAPHLGRSADVHAIQSAMRPQIGVDGF